jgi:hypothetical protein
MSLAEGIRKPLLGAHTIPCAFAALIFPVTLSVARAAAQQVTGTLGSASATTTVDGKQLPASPPKFGGVIKESAKDSTPWWPPLVVPPKGAPNLLLIMTDDQGYGVPGTFGGVIPTPALLASHSISSDRVKSRIRFQAEDQLDQ